MSGVRQRCKKNQNLLSGKGGLGGLGAWGRGVQGGGGGDGGGGGVTSFKDFWRVSESRPCISCSKIGRCRRIRCMMGR